MVGATNEKQAGRYGGKSWRIQGLYQQIQAGKEDWVEANEQEFMKITFTIGERWTLKLCTS